MNRIITVSDPQCQTTSQNGNSPGYLQGELIKAKPEINGFIFESEILETIRQQFPNKMLLSIKEAADALSVSMEFIRKRIADGIINSVSMGDRKMISINELARLIYEGV